MQLCHEHNVKRLRSFLYNRRLNEETHLKSLSYAGKVFQQGMILRAKYLNTSVSDWGCITCSCPHVSYLPLQNLLPSADRSKRSPFSAVHWWCILNESLVFLVSCVLASCLVLSFCKKTNFCIFPQNVTVTREYSFLYHLDILAEFLQLYNPANRKIRLIFG